MTPNLGHYGAHKATPDSAKVLSTINQLGISIHPNVLPAYV